MKRNLHIKSPILNWTIMLMLLFVSSLTTFARVYDGNEKIYLRPSAVTNWEIGHNVGLYFFNATTNQFVEVMWLVDNSGGNVWYATVPAGNWSDVIVTQHNATPISWGNKTKQSGNISIPATENYIYSFSEGSATATWQSIKAHYRSKQSGNWSALSTWRCSFDTNWDNSWNYFDAHVIPNQNDLSVTIMDTHSVQLNQNTSISSLKINSGGTFTASDATARTLTITKSASGSSVTLSNSGTWASGTGESTVVFTGAPSSVDAVHEITGTIAFQKVIINKTGGTANVGAGFGANSSVSVSLEIGEGGYVSTDPPASFYGTNAVLKFNQGASATYDVNSGDRTWSTTVIPNSITINSGTVALKSNRTASGSVIVEEGATLNVDADKQLTAGVLTNDGTLTLKTDATVLATTVSGAGTTNVEQALSSGRQWWYLSSPLSGSTSNVIRPAASTHLIGDYTESTASYSAPFAAGSGTPLTVGKGYVVKFSNTDARTLTFTGGSLNNSQVNYDLTRTLAAGAKRGFHLIGNPYPSYLNWDAAYNDDDDPAANMRNSIWIRTWNGSAMVFNTYADEESVPLGTNGKIAPMQAFWVKVHADGNNGTLKFKNTHRSHFVSGNNPLKVKAADNRQRLRLTISNGTAQDEMLVVGKSYASNGLDSYDIEKMTNSTASIPEIYSLVQNEELVINSMNQLSAGAAVAVGMRPGQSGSFTLQVSQFENINDKVYLVDHLTNTETELTAGTQYSFTSDETATNERFSVEFRAPGMTTALNEATSANTFAFVNEAGQISVQSAAGKDASISIFNMAGQQLAAQQANGSLTTIEQPFSAGVYLVKVNNHIQKVVIK